MSTTSANQAIPPQVSTPTLSEIFFGKAGNWCRQMRIWRGQGLLSKARHATRCRQVARMEMMEPRVLLSADSVLGAGATAAIVDSFMDYSALVQDHIDIDDGYATLVPGLLLTQRETDGVAGIDDKDQAIPHMRDLLAVEIEQSPGTSTQELILQALDTDDDTTVSWKEAYDGIIVQKIESLLNTYNADNTFDASDDINSDTVIDSLDVEQWVFDGLTDAFTGTNFADSSILDPRLDVVLTGLAIGGNAGTFSIGFNAAIDFVDNYQIDLGIKADEAEIGLARYQFNYGSPITVTELSRDVSITGQVVAPIAVSYSSGPDASFAATDVIHSSVKAGGDGSASLVGKVVNVGFLGTQAVAGSSFDLSMEIDTRITDPSSPEHLGFVDGDGNDNYAEKLAFEAQSSGGVLTGGDLGSDAFNLATPVLFNLTLTYGTGSSGAVPFSINLASAGDQSAVQAALNAAIGASSLNGLLTTSLSGSALTIHLTGSDATPLGFTDGTHSDTVAPFTLAATNGFDFDTNNDAAEDGDDTPVLFSAATFLLSVGGALPQIVTVAGGNYTSTAWRSAVQTALDDKFGGGVVTAALNTANLNSVKLTLSAGSTLEIADTDTLSLKMTAVNSITKLELTQLAAADPDQTSRLFTSTPDTATDAFAIKLNLQPRAGLDFTPSGTPQFLIDSTFSTFDGPFDLPGVAPVVGLADGTAYPLRFALEMQNTDFDQYLDFNVFGRDETIAMIQQIEGWAERLEQSVALSGYDIPLLQSVLGQVLNFSDLIHDKFLVDDNDTSATGDDAGKLLQKITALDPDNPSIIFFTAQELGAALNKIGVVDTTGLPPGDFATYDTVNKDILYKLTATHAIADVTLPVDFTLPLPPLGSIYSTSSLFLTAEGSLNAMLGLHMGEAGSIDPNPVTGTLLTELNNGTGVDIYEGVASAAITAAAAVDRVYGRLLSDATFDVVLAGVTYTVTVSAGSTATNLLTSELVTDIGTALTTAVIKGTATIHDLSSQLSVTQSGDRLALQAAPGVTGFSLMVEPGNTAFTQLGLQTGLASTVSWTSAPIADVAAGNGGVLTIDIFGPTLAVGLTIDNAAGNASVTDLVVDINEKIAASALNGKIVATRLGDRIEFSAIDSSIYGFSVDADATAGQFFSDDFTVAPLEAAWLTVVTPNEPDSAADSLARYGRLSSAFSLNVNGAGVSITVAETETFGSLQQFVDLLNAKIPGTSIVADLDAGGSRILLRVNSDTVTSLTIDTPSAGAEEMGFFGTQTAGRLEVTGNRAAPSYFGPTGIVTFHVDIVGGDADTGGVPKTVTLDYSNPATRLDILSNASVYDLAADVQRALNATFGSALDNPLKVDIDAGRLLFTIKAGSSGLGATDFVIKANTAIANENRAIQELGLSNPGVVPAGIVTLDANTWDLLITDSNSKVFGVTLDGATTVGDVLSKINTAAAAAGSDVIAGLNDFANGLKLSEASVGPGQLRVSSVNGSDAAIDLGIYLGGTNQVDATSSAPGLVVSPGEIVGSSIGTLALIDRVFLRQVDGSTPILSATLSITSDNPDTGPTEELALEANFGFVAVTATGGGTLTGSVGVGLQSDSDGRVTVRDLFSAVSSDLNGDHVIDISDFTQVVTAPEFDLSGDFALDVAVVPGGGVGSVISDLTVGSLSIHVTDAGNPFALVPVAPDVDVTWTAGALGDLEQFSNIDFADVLNGLKALADFLDQYAEFGFLNAEIPLIGVSFNDLVDLADRFRAAVVEIEQNPAGSVQLLEQKIREEFGLPPGILTLSLADGDDAGSAPGDMLKIAFNLGGGFSESLPVEFGVPDDLIDGAPVDISLQGHADLNATGTINAKFTIGIDLNTALGLAAPVFLYTGENDTRINGSLSASANDLSFNAALGPVGVTIADGSASLNIAADFKSTDADGTRVALSSAFSHFTEISFNGSANAVMPVYFPTQSSYIGDIGLVAAFEADGSNGLDVTTFDVTAPDFNLDFSSFSLFDNLGLLIDATDFFLSGVQDALDGQILGFELPLVGDNLADAAQFIEDFRAGFIHDLRNLVENAPSLAAETVQGFLWDLLGTSGINLLADTDGSGIIDQADVIIEGLATLTDGDISNDYLQWNILLGKTFSPDINIDFDLGFPALGLKSDVELNVDLTWELGIGLGISLADGAYIDVKRQDYTTPADDVLPEMQLIFDISLADTSSLTGSLLFLQLDINEAARDVNDDGIADPTHFHAEFSVDLTNGGDPDVERLSFSELGNLDFTLDLDANAAVNLDLTLKFNEDLIGSSPISAILPEIQAHFALYWEVENVLTGDVDLGEGLQYLAFEDVSLDLGKFLGDLIVPLVEKIQSVTEPFQPIIDIVTAAIPVLSDLAGEPVTLLDIAASFGEFNPDLIYAVADLISLVNSIPTNLDTLIIPFGDFVIYDEGGSGFGGVTASQLADPNFNFGQQGDSDPFSAAFSAIGAGLPQISDLISSATGAGNATGNAAAGLLGGNFNATGTDGKPYGFKFDLFENPSQIFGLLVGRQAVIVTYDLPPFSMDFSWTQSFPIYGPLWGVVTAGVGMKIDLAFGYDTQGVADFFNSGFSNPLTLLGGLYVSDTDHADGTGVDVPELVFTGTIGVGAELNAGIASAGVTANIILTVDFDLYDPNHDGKIRIDELVDTFLYEIRSGDPELAPLALFDISGEISLQLKAYIKFLFAKFDFEITPPITLFEFSIPFEREPFLATERDDGSLLLNIGTNANARMNGDLRDLSEEICVQVVDGTHVKVWSESLGVTEGGAQIYTIDPNQGVFAYGGEGNDVIVVHGDVKVTAEGGTGDDIIVVDGGQVANLHGNLGNDTLVGGSAADIIYGDEGDDVIDGREGNDWIFGDFGQLSYGPTGSIRVTAGPKDGNDVIWGGLGEDIVFGGGGNDSIAGDTGTISGITVSSITDCGVAIAFGAGADTDGNADFLFGDGGRIDALGSSGVDELLPNLTKTTVDGRSVFAGISLTDRDGGGNDLVLGQGGTDVIFAGSGDDRADGGAGNDTIFGETGLDVLSGGANDDEISGGLSKDFIFGYGEGSGDPYNDGGNTTADGNDLLFGDDGNDLMRGNGGDDTLFGGRGADVLFGDAGNDTIFGENEADVVFGGAGNDYVEGGTGNDTVFGDDGLVIYFTGVEDDHTDDRVIGDAFAFGGTDALFDYYDDGSGTPTGDDDADLTLDLMVTYVRAGSDGDDIVIGGEGDDIAFGGAGNDTLFGDIDPAQWLAEYATATPPPVPAGADVLIGDGGRIEWFGRRIDRIESFAGATAADAGNDTISGNGGADRLLGGGGNDEMYGRMPASFADGVNALKLNEDVGIDADKRASDNDIMIGDDGVIDFVRGTTRLASISTTVNTPLAGETYNDTMFGNWGNDIMLGGLRDDTMRGDTGLSGSEPRTTDDIMVGDNGVVDYDDVDSVARIAQIYSTDTTSVTGGNDQMFGQEGIDIMIGGVGDDNMSGSLANDIMAGDSGWLRYEVDADYSTLDLVTTDLTSKGVTLGLGGVDTVSGDDGSDIAFGGAAGDFIYGNNVADSNPAADLADILLGDNGKVMLAGGLVTQIRTLDPTDGTGGVDVIRGNRGDDLIAGGVQGDEIRGNEGSDIVFGDNAQIDVKDADGNPLTLDLLVRVATTIEPNTGGSDTIYGFGGGGAPGLEGNDILIGGSKGDVIEGNDGDDLIIGDGGRVVFNAEGESNAALASLDLVETIQADASGGGVDTISGNAGRDVAFGGEQGDFVYGDAAGAAPVADTPDGGDVLVGDEGRVNLVPIAVPVAGQGFALFGGAFKTLVTTDKTVANGGIDTHGGNDTINGNDDNDIILGGFGGDLLSGNDENDIVLGDEGRLEWLYTGNDDVAAVEASLPNAGFDASYNTLDLITTFNPTFGGRDTIYGDTAGLSDNVGIDNDILLGGTDTDIMAGGADNDVMFGDHGRLYPQHSALALGGINSRNFFAIDMGNDDGGDGDVMYGDDGLFNAAGRQLDPVSDGNDIMLGQQGDDRMWGGGGDDDMIGGHNRAGGVDELTVAVADIGATINPPVSDMMDGGSGDDAMAGDNAVIWRRNDDVSPRFRLLTASSLYTTTETTITTNIGAVGQSDPDDAVGRDITVLDHSDGIEAAPNGRYGNDVMAGGADSDTMFGQLGNDLMQGDGYIQRGGVTDGASTTRQITVTDSGGSPNTAGILFFKVPEQATDADDYMEGNGGNDLMYGGLGQDDMIGGSSALFGLNTEVMRPDGSDTIFGGAGIDISRNNIGDAAEDGTTHVIATTATGHARDADFIMGDNANVFRPAKAPDDFYTFNYDNYGTLRIVPRAMQQLDYTLGGGDFAGGGYNGFGQATPTGKPADNGLADLIHGESGDDYIFGMTGSDVIFGEGQDDDIVGGYGNDWISGGTGQDGVLGDDGLIRTSRNSAAGEPLYGVAGLTTPDDPKYNQGTVLDELISTPGNTQIATINVSGELKKTADITPFSYDATWLALDDEFPDNISNTPFADDIIFGGLGSDFLHGGSGDDAISGAEALEHAYVPAYALDGITPIGKLDLGYLAVGIPSPSNPGDVLAFNSQDVDGVHESNRFRAGEFRLYDEFDPRRMIQLDATGNLWKSSAQGAAFEFLLNFDETEGVFRASGTVPKATGQQTETYPEVHDDGRDLIFGDLGNDWLVGGTGRDDLFGGWGNDYLNADDNLHTETTDVAAAFDNESPDTHPYYEDRAYGGAGRDILIGNTGGDRLIDWVGEYNSFLVPYAPFGQASVSRTLMPHLHEFLYALSAGDGADSTRYSDAIGGTPPAPTTNDPIPSRNGEPHGELGLVLQKDFAWQDQTGAPADPQAGNIPGGHRDVLRSANFGNGDLAASGFAVDSGSFAVSGGALQVAAASLGKDATGVFTLDEQLPSYYEFLASVKVDKATAGWKANSFLIFDYFDKTDFKFAGVDISTNKLVIGYHDASGWHVVKDVPSQLKAGITYNMGVYVNGTNVTLIVDNTSILSYTFGQRMIDGEGHNLNMGLLGLGSDNSRGSFDNVVVQRVPPGYTFQQTEQFNAGPGTLFDGDTLGTWQVVNGRYEDTAANGLAYSLVDLGLGRGLETNAILELSAKFNVTGTGGFIFDRYADNDYKFVTIDAAANKVYIGHVSPQGGLKIDASFSKVIDPGIEYTLTLSLKGTSASVSLAAGTGAASLVGGFVFNGVTLDGGFGLLSTIGKTSYDSVTVKTNDSAFTPPTGGAMLAAEAPAASSGAEIRLTQSQLDSTLAAAVGQWTSLLGANDPRVALLAGVRISTSNLSGLALGRSDGANILVDSDAAGHGWFVDTSPADNSEFRLRLDRNVLGATRSSDAFGDMDLLTVVTHELGHVLGLDHDSGYAVMDHDLEAGVRYVLATSPDSGRPAAGAADQSAGWDVWNGEGSAAGTIDWGGNGGWNPLSPFQGNKPGKGGSPNFANFLLRF